MAPTTADAGAPPPKADFVKNSVAGTLAGFVQVLVYVAAAGLQERACRTDPRGGERSIDAAVPVARSSDTGGSGTGPEAGGRTAGPRAAADSRSTR